MLKEMSSDEYIDHIKESFEDKYFTEEGKFIFSKAALIDGLYSVQEDSILMEHYLDQDIFVKNDLTYLARKMQVISNVLNTSMSHFRLENNEEAE